MENKNDSDIPVVNRDSINMESIYNIPKDVDIPVYLVEHKDEINKHVFARYKDMVKNDLKKVDIFMYGDFLLGINRDDLLSGLQSSLDYFVETEQYKLAQQAYDTITDLKMKYNGM